MSRDTITARDASDKNIEYRVARKKKSPLIILNNMRAFSALRKTTTPTSINQS
jgi:hypothetical protein